MSIINTTDFNADLLVRQVDESFRLLLRKNYSILDRLLANGWGYQPGRNNKYEWLGSQLAQTKFNKDGDQTLTGTTPLVMNFVSTQWLEAGMHISFKSIAGRDIEWPAGEVVALYVIDVPTVTTATVITLPWTFPTALIPWGSIASFTRPVRENKKVFAGENNRQPTLEYNHFQIFDRQVELSNTALNSAMYWDPNFLQNQLQQGMFAIMQDMQEAVSTGIRVARGELLAPGIFSEGSMGWYRTYIDTPNGNRINAAGANLDKALLNDAAQSIIEDGGSFDAIIVWVEKAREISAFNTAGTNPIVFVQQGSEQAGEVIRTFQSDIPLQWWLVSTIIVDNKLSNDKVILTDLSRHAVVPFQNRSLRLADTSANGQDGSSVILRGEYTYVVKDGDYSHALIRDLA